MHDGKLYISMNDAVALALENNLDIAIARYNLNIADTDVWRAKAGANTILGVNSGVVQNTPGGGVGGLGTQVGSGQGGTSVAAGGAGAGIGGLVESTLGSGPLITSFDPVLTGTLQFDHNSILLIQYFHSCSLREHHHRKFRLPQGFQWGTNLSVGFNNTRQTFGNAPFTTLSPQLNSSFNFKLTQHLLQGFGFAPNTRFIQIAKNDREISDVAFRLQIITTVDQIENMYWDLVYAYENVRVQKEQLAFAQRTLSDTQETGRNRHPGADRSGPGTEHGRHRSANPDPGTDQSSTAATADEECAQPHAGRPGAGRCRSDSHLDHGVVSAGSGCTHPGSGE